MWYRMGFSMVLERRRILYCMVLGWGLFRIRSKGRTIGYDFGFPAVAFEAIDSFQTRDCLPLEDFVGVDNGTMIEEGVWMWCKANP